MPKRYKVICHKDLNDPIVVYNLIQNYKLNTGKDYLGEVSLKKYNYNGFSEFLKAYGLATQWWISKQEKFKNSPFTKVRWLDFIPIIMKQKGCDKDIAMNILSFIFSKMTVSQDALRKEFFFSLYTLDKEEFLSFDYELIPEEINDFVFFIEKITEDGVRPKYHPEKIPFISEEDSFYFKKVPNDSLVFDKEEKEYLENIIQDRIAITDSDEEIAFLFRLAETMKLGVLK